MESAAPPLTIAPALPPDWSALEVLVQESVHEGYRFLARLKAEYLDGTQRFDGPGETLLGIYRGTELLGIGALTHDPFSNEEGVGRIRRVYIRENARRIGAATLLVRALMGAATGHFHMLTLRSVTDDADRLYESLGFHRVIDYPNVTHAWTLPGGGE